MRAVQHKFERWGYRAGDAYKVGMQLLSRRLQSQAMFWSAQNIYLGLGVTAFVLLVIVSLIKKLDIHYLKAGNSYALPDG